MCGIAGIMTTDGSRPAEALVARLSAALLHRGPDGTGDHVANDVALTQRRLAIIDLATGDQPLFEPHGGVLIGNAEIYNYIELKRELLPDVAFATASDCEVPLHLYRRQGLGFAAALRGMYALAIHDVPAHKLILARDRFGIKPLYYVEAPGCFAFASEPQALLAAGLASRAVVPAVRDELLQLQFTTGAQTIFPGIKRVLPGETLLIVDGRIKARHRLEALPAGAPVPIDQEEALTRLDRALAESVDLHQRSDVPYGMFLSGGIDSTVLLAEMAELNRSPVRAITLGFGGTAAADERNTASETARMLGAEHYSVDFTESDFWRLAPAAAAAMDDPSADYAILPTLRLGEIAHERGLKVVLSGEGGDELVAGYGRYRSLSRPWWAGGRQSRVRGNFDGLGILRDGARQWRDGIVAAEIRVASDGRTRLQAAQALDCADWLPNDLLTKLDRCLMAYGVEGRTPFLETEFAAFAFRLPDQLKIHERRGKYLLRRWLARRLPSADAMARKRGFTVPVAEWIGRHGARLGRLVAGQEAIRELCLPGRVEALFQNVEKRRCGFAAWTLLFYALWHRTHIRSQPLAGDVWEALG
jgi:asparagine synthase (glutamine-hydrolysing)